MYRLFYVILNFVGIFITLFTNTSIYRPRYWLYKVILIHISSFLILNNMRNKIINHTILPLLLYLNIAILLIVQYSINKKAFFSFVVLIYLLLTFHFKDFKFKDGILMKLNKKWIYSHIILLSLWYLLLPNKCVLLYSKLGLVILILYPLLFPLEEYFIHRATSLSICSAIHWYLSSKAL